MKLDRNINADGRGKYGLIKNRRLNELLCGDGRDDDKQAIHEAVALLEAVGVIDWGTIASTEFFVIRLKDQFAANALFAYGITAGLVDPEYGKEVEMMSHRAGANHPFCKKPD